MQKQIYSVIAVLFFAFLSPRIHAQKTDEQITLEMMKNNGASDADIAQWVMNREIPSPSKTQKQSFKNPNLNAVGSCSDMGGENGWGVWEASTGYVLYVVGGTTFVTTGQTPTAPRFNLLSGVGVDGCTPGPNPSDPSLPYVAPGFGNTSIQLGEPAANGNMGGCNGGPYGGCAERLTYNMQVTSADTNFSYAYAVVLENPCNAKHTGDQVPFAEIFILYKNGDTIPCSYHKYIGDTTGSCNPPPSSGMYKASCVGSGGASSTGNGYDVSYIPWTMSSINLGSYVGQVVKIIITNADCALGIHYCYSYWDFKCSSSTPTTVTMCAGQTATLNAPASQGATYTWYHNHNLYTGPPSATSSFINPIPVAGDTFSVHVNQPGGCSFWMSYVPDLTTVVPNFSFSGTCGNMTFTDNSSISPSTSSSTITNWNWHFPGGNPSSSSSQNPSQIHFPTGTYTVSLIVTSSAGCVDTIKKTITVKGLASTMNQTNAQCGVNGSASVSISGGTPAYTYQWNNGASTSSATNLSAGNYSVTVTDATGCTAGNTVTITNNTNITANATSSTVCAGQNAVLTASGGMNYLWSNGATTSSISPPTTSSSTFTVIVSSGACTDTAYATLSVTPSPSLNLGTDQTICTAQNFTLDAGNTGASYLWSTGQTTQTITTSGTGTYWVIAGINNCLAKDTITIAIAPEIHLSDSSLCTVSPIVLDAGSGATSYAWSTGDDAPSISVDVAGTYWVQAMYGNCLRTDTAKITGDGMMGGALWVPNTFTPNDDYLNEIFLAKGIGIETFEMRIFDRWGNQVFVSHDINKGWDGKIEGGHYILKGDGKEPSQEDVYIWKINYSLQCFPDRMKREIGQVSILK